jgi:hypothetical protein
VWLSSVALSPASQYVKSHAGPIFSCHIPVPLHWTGLVLDGGAPFGISKLRYVRAVRGWHGTFRVPSLRRFLCEGVLRACISCVFVASWSVCFPLFRVLSLLPFFVCPFAIFVL